MNLTPEQIEVLRRMSHENIWSIDAYLMREWGFDFRQCIEARKFIKELPNETKQETLKAPEAKAEGGGQENSQTPNVDSPNEEVGRKEESSGGNDTGGAQAAERVQEGFPSLDIDAESIKSADELPF